MKNWNLKVKEFGKIKEADIEISPFTLFVGDNNSGKSYLMSLIYGIMKIKLNPFEYNINKESEAYKGITNWIQSLEMEKDFEIKVEENQFKLFINILNETLMNNKKRFIKSIFNMEIELGEIELTFKYNDRLYMKKTVRETFIEAVGENDNEVFSDILEREKEIEILFIEKDEHGRLKGGLRIPSEVFNRYDLVIFGIIQQIIKLNCFDCSTKGVCYLPTSRTGFLLTYKTLVEGSIKDKFNAGETEKNLLTRPCSDFLTDLSSISKDDLRETYNHIVKFIEEYIIDGKVEIDETPISDLKYIPNGSNEQLPMFISSGVITEMTPLLLMLKYKKDLCALMMEEPEMCLHPKLQWLISRALIQIANTDTQVIITTHSDIILQNINNIIKLSANSNKEKLMNEYRYTEKDLITSDKIKMYQLDVIDHKTTITKLECGEFGFEVPTFNKMLEDLLEQSRAFEE